MCKHRRYYSKTYRFLLYKQNDFLICPQYWLVSEIRLKSDLSRVFQIMCLTNIFHQVILSALLSVALSAFSILILVIAVERQCQHGGGYPQLCIISAYFSKEKNVLLITNEIVKDVALILLELKVISLCDQYRASLTRLTIFSWTVLENGSRIAPFLKIQQVKSDILTK